MTEINGGGPAFPTLDWSQVDKDGDLRHYSQGGLTMRDFMAARAPVTLAMVADSIGTELVYELQAHALGQSYLFAVHAKLCHDWADAMLKAREVQPPQLASSYAEVLDSLRFAIRFFDQLTPADAERMRKVLDKATGSQP